MTWEDPRLFGIGAGGFDGAMDCKHGYSPKLSCDGGIEDWVQCWPGGHIQTELCLPGPWQS